jgi:hypothetical protein
MVITSSTIALIQQLGDDLTKEVLESRSPPGSVERCQDLVTALSIERMTFDILQSTRIGVTVGKVIKALKRHLRTAAADNDGDHVSEWKGMMEELTALVKQWKELAANSKNKNSVAAAAVTVKESKAASTVVSTSTTTKSCPPGTVAEYRDRLVKHNKELYKDPPVLPPRLTTTARQGRKSQVVVSFCDEPPKRDKKTGMLTFSMMANDPDQQEQSNSDKATLKRLMESFHPNRTPEEILRAGAFGGTYFRAIHSAVTNQLYNPQQVLADTVRPSWIKGLDASKMLTSLTYHVHINKYGVKCGGSLGMWESSGWISEIDPYGWFQWYCRFYQGRRSTDDARQISRWAKSAGPTGRFRSQLCNKILAAAGSSSSAKKSCDNYGISPVIRQTLLHWGLEITQDVLEAHRKRVGK